MYSSKKKKINSELGFQLLLFINSFARWQNKCYRNFQGLRYLGNNVLVRSVSDGVPQGSVVGPLYFADPWNTALVCWLWLSSMP